MPQVVTDIIITKADVWSAPVGTSIPADTVAAGASWSGWTRVGFTKEGVKLAYEFDTADAKIQQALAPVLRRKKSEGVKLETVMAEFTADGLKLAWGNGTVTQTAAGAGQPGKEEYVVGGSPVMDEKAWGFEGSYIDEDGATFPIRVFIFKATAEAGGDLEFTKEDQTGVPLKLAALEDMTKSEGQRLFKVQKILEPAS